MIYAGVGQDDDEAGAAFSRDIYEGGSNTTFCVWEEDSNQRGCGAGEAGSMRILDAYVLCRLVMGILLSGTPN